MLELRPKPQSTIPLVVESRGMKGIQDQLWGLFPTSSVPTGAAQPETSKGWVGQRPSTLSSEWCLELQHCLASQHAGRAENQVGLRPCV